MLNVHGALLREFGLARGGRCLANLYCSGPERMGRCNWTEHLFIFNRVMTKSHNKDVPSILTGESCRWRVLVKRAFWRFREVSWYPCDRLLNGFFRLVENIFFTMYH